MTSKTTVSGPPLAQWLTRRLTYIAISVFLINSLAVGIYYGSNSRELDAEVIADQMERLEADLLDRRLPNHASFRSLYKEHPSDYAFAIVDRSGAVLDAMNLEHIPPSAIDLFADEWMTRLDNQDTPLLVGGHELYSRKDGLRAVFVMKEDPANLLLRAYLAEFYEHVWFPILPLIFLLLGTNLFLIRKGLSPISKAAAWARDLQPGKSVPPPRLHLPADIADLMEATERSINRLEEALTLETRRAAEIAHALRTPVAVLLARVDALPSGNTKVQLREDIAALSRMVQQVLASSRVETMAEQQPVPTELNALAETVVIALAPFAYEHGLTLTLNTTKEPVMVEAIPEAAELALYNLIENAILHGGKGPIEVSVSEKPSIMVSDCGPGLSDPQDSSIYKAFWRGPDARAGGTGLGLAIVDRLQRIQNGQIVARNKPAQGAEFELCWRKQQS